VTLPGRKILTNYGYSPAQTPVDFRHIFAYIFAYALWVMDPQKQNGALLIAACLIAAIRLRGEPIERSPKVVATMSDSVRLARSVLQELQR
jgi:hypothetical protein